jgi:hypothetical protein
MSVSRYEPALHRVLWELRPYLDAVMVIGGWVPYLYSRYGGFVTWNGRTPLTAEVDVLLERPLPAGERASIADILRDAGFQPTTDGAGSAVWVGDVASGEMIEFLIPHTGTVRQIGDTVPVAAQPGLRAISLPGLDLMQRFKQTLPVPVITNAGSVVLPVNVPWLGAYLVNKASTFTRRQPHALGGSKRYKDLLYLRDVMAAGAEVVRHVRRVGGHGRRQQGCGRDPHCREQSTAGERELRGRDEKGGRSSSRARTGTVTGIGIRGTSRSS